MSMTKLLSLAGMATLSCLSACGSRFSEIPANNYTALKDGAIKLTAPMTACGTTFPTGSQLQFDEGRNRGLSRAIVGDTTIIEGHSYAPGTTLHFLSEPRKLFAAEQCEFFRADLAREDLFGPNTFGAGDSLFARSKGTFHEAILAAPRTLAGKTFGAKYHLKLDDAGAIVQASSPAEQDAAEVRGNAFQRAADEKRSGCNSRCAPLSGSARADCINNCLR